MTENLNDQSSPKKALDYAIRILSIKDYSIYKMRMKLKERKFSSEDIETTIEKLLEYNYLREEEYARMRIKQLLVKGFSNSYILRKLEYEELTATESDIDAIREEQDLGSETQIDYLVEKKLRYKEIPQDFEGKMKLKKKVLTFLISKGYNFEEANSALSKRF